MKRITGYVSSSRDAEITIALIGIGKVEVTIDTGFDGALMLPKTLIERSNFQPLGSVSLSLAGGRRAKTENYLAQIEWLGETRFVEVLIGNGYLLGTELLAETRLIVDYVKQTVKIEGSLL